MSQGLWNWFRNLFKKNKKQTVSVVIPDSWHEVKQPPIMWEEDIVMSIFPNKEWEKFMFDLIVISKLPHIKVSDTWFDNTRMNWVRLFAAMAKFESGFKATSTYTENFKDSNGNYIISTGLFQLSQESARGYGFKVTTENLMDPFVNMKIAVTIMEKWVIKDGCIAGDGKYPYKGGARYWSVLRSSGKLEKVKQVYLEQKV